MWKKHEWREHISWHWNLCFRSLTLFFYFHTIILLVTPDSDKITHAKTVVPCNIIFSQNTFFLSFCLSDWLITLHTHTCIPQKHKLHLLHFWVIYLAGYLLRDTWIPSDNRSKINKYNTAHGVNYINWPSMSFNSPWWVIIYASNKLYCFWKDILPFFLYQ